VSRNGSIDAPAKYGAGEFIDMPFEPSNVTGAEDAAVEKTVSIEVSK
jgi:hypothetical protein